MLLIFILLESMASVCGNPARVGVKFSTDYKSAPAGAFCETVISTLLSFIHRLF